MNTSANILMEVIKKQLLFNPSTESLEKYLRELFSSFSLTNAKNQQCIDQITFQEYFTYPMFISDKLFSTLTASLYHKTLNEPDFVNFFLTLLCGDYDHLLKLLIRLFEYNLKGIIYKENIQLLFKALDYDNFNTINEIISETFMDNQFLPINKFYDKALNTNGDIPILFFMYLIINLPFNEKDVNYFINKSINNNNSNKSTPTFSNYISKPIRQSDSNVTIYLSEKMCCFIMEKFGLNIWSKSKEDLEVNESQTEKEEDDLEELNAFEEDVSTILSTFELDMSLRIRRKSEMDMNNLGLWKKHNITLSTAHHKSIFLESTPGSDKTHASSLTTFIYEKKKHLASCYNNNNSNNDNETNNNSTLLKPVVPYHNINDDIISTFKVSFMNKYNNLINCKLVFIHKTLYIEKDCQYKKNNDKPDNMDQDNFNNNNINVNDNNNQLYSLNNGSCGNNNTNNKLYLNNKGKHNNNDCFAYKYFRLIPLRSIYSINLGSLKINNVDYHGMKLVSHMHNLSHEIIFYSQEAEHIKDATDIINNAVGIRDIKEDYEFEFSKEINQGSYSKVYFGFNKKTQVKVAIKQIENYNKKKDHLLFKRECEILQFLMKNENENVVKLIDIYKSTSSLYMVFEYLNGMTLMKYLNEYNGKICVQQKLNMINQIANGINFLHCNNIIHRDIKADNIIVMMSLNPNTNESNLTPSIKIIDFGFASMIAKDEYCSECYGTLLYIAPELLMRKKYNFSADIWSFGVVLYQILFHHLPFGETSDDLKEIQSQIVQCNYSIPSNSEYEENYPQYLNLVKQCLMFSSEKRLNSNQIVSELP